MGKKYEKYQIVVQYYNGDTENINLAGINTSNYNNMINVYHNVKKKYYEGVKAIDFVGIGKDGSLGILFRKENKNKTGRDDLKENVEDIMNRISKDMLLIKEKNFYHYDMISALNKKEDMLLHTIESFKNRKFKNDNQRDREKIKIFNILEGVRDERRWHKEQLDTISKLQQHTLKEGMLNVTHLSNVFKASKTNKKMQYLDFKVAEQKKIYTEELIKDKDRQVKKLKKDYEKVIIDEANERIIAYNKSKCA
ncbi:hypothetical protein DVV91_10315 [Clostridium botulinum]|uniref:hypothetical protein n=1 Tax=Clostridium botulinum TaxID=1491 RepID=UPI00196786CA|nr:hypothetical protein [Clostridium botulinum]MBN1074736.1 hypothetical protein [Clostridium botulinum]